MSFIAETRAGFLYLCAYYIRDGPLEIPGGAKNFQCTNLFFSPSCLQDFFFFDIVGLFLDGGLLAGFLFFKIFLCRNFFSGIVTPPPVISNGRPLIYEHM